MLQPNQRSVSTFSEEQIRQMFAACDLTTVAGQRDRAIMMVLLETGIRPIELCRLHVDDIREASLHVQGKENREHEVKLAPAVSEQLKLYRECYRPSSQSHALFVNDADQALTPRDVSRIVQVVKERAGIRDPHLSAHAFRSTFAAKSFRSRKQS
jgi:site-specific recombinase XerD